MERPEGPRPDNPRVASSIYAGFTPADSPLVWEDYVDDQELADLRTTDLSAGAPAPPVALPFLDLDTAAPAGAAFDLRAACAERPQALVFGSYTCPPFRNSIPAVEEVFRRHGEAIGFTLVYVHEAHAEDGWVVTGNREAGVEVMSPTTLEERAALAHRLATERGVTMPLALDRLDDGTCRAYGGMPNRLVLVGTDGRLAYLSGEGPVGFLPDELDAAIAALTRR